MKNRYRTGRRVSGLWMALAAVGGATVAFLADPDRGKARREAAAARARTAFRTAAGRTKDWQRALAERTSRNTPQMISVGTVPASETKGQDR